MADENMFFWLKAPGWEKTEEGADAIWEVLFEKEGIPNSPYCAPILTMTDPERGFGVAYPKASELEKFGVPHSILHARAKENLLGLKQKPEWIVVKPVTTYKILTLFSKSPFISEFILDPEVMIQAEKILKADSVVVGIPRRELMFVCSSEDAANPDLVPNFSEFIKLQYHDSKPIAGPMVTPIVYFFKEGQVRGYVKEVGLISEPQVQEVFDDDETDKTDKAPKKVLTTNQ